jgi:hypothetical protein
MAVADSVWTMHCVGHPHAVFAGSGSGVANEVNENLAERRHAPREAPVAQLLLFDWFSALICCET